MTLTALTRSSYVLPAVADADIFFLPSVSDMISFGGFGAASLLEVKINVVHVGDNGNGCAAKGHGGWFSMMRRPKTDGRQLRTIVLVFTPDDRPG